MKLTKAGLTFTAEDDQVWVSSGEFCSSLTVVMASGRIHDGENEKKLTSRQLDICEEMEDLFVAKGLY